jgi:kynurenine formamidase
MKKAIAVSVLVLFALVSFAAAGNVTKQFGKVPIPKMSPYLKSLIKTGDVWDIGSPRSWDMPLWPGHPAFRVIVYKYHGETQDVTPPATLLNELFMGCFHSGTHTDALNHIGEIQPDGTIRVYGWENGHSIYKTSDKAKEWWGVNIGDASQFTPQVLRAVVLDMAKYLGTEDTGGEKTVKRAYTYTIDDVKGCMKAEGLEFKPDVPTAFLFRSGHYKYFKNRSGVFGGENPGPDVEVEKFLQSMGGVVTGSDTVSYERMLVGTHPVHRYMMQNGLFMLEVANLEDICEGGVYEGVFISLPLKIKGASASLVDPIIIN